MTDAIIYSTGMTLLHSLWQFTVIYFLLRLVLHLLKNRSADFRYKISGTALLTSLLIAGITFSIYYSEARSGVEATYKILSELGTKNLISHSNPGAIINPDPHSAGISVFLPYIVMIYFAGLLFLSIRLIASLVYLNKYRTRSIIKTETKLTECFNKLVIRFRIRKKIQIRESLITRIPLVLGYLKPVVIVRAGFFMQLPYNQVEAILAHELAHIKRNDFIINILQSVVEILFFYHPCIYLISKNIRTERENCCDDIALSYCKDSKIYIEALAGMESKLQITPYPAVAFVKQKNNLLDRMKRILKPRTMKTKLSDRIIAGVIILAGFFTLTLTGAATLSNISGEQSEPLEGNISHSINLDGYSQGPGLADTIIDMDDDRIITHRENKKGEKEKVEMRFDNGKLTQLVINGKMIPEEEYINYKKLIADTRQEIAKASQEVAKAEKELDEIKEEEIEREIQQALEEARAVSEEEIEMEIEKAMGEIEKIEQEEIRKEVETALEEARRELERAEMEDINWDSLQTEIDKALSEIDWEEIKKEIRKAMEEVEMSEEEIDRAMEETSKAMEEIDWNEIHESIQKGIDAARVSLEAIEWDVIGESIDLSLDITADVLSEIHLELEEAMKDIDIETEINEAREDVKREKEKLENLDKNMEKALEELEKK